MTDILEPIIVTTDAAEAFLGAVLHQDRLFAGAFLRRVTEDDLADPRHRAIFRLAVDLVNRGEAPDPTAVFAEAQRRGDIHGEQRSSALSKLLIDLFTRCPIPNAGDHYAIAVLDGSLRRRILQAGQRLAQVAEESGLEDAMTVVERELQAVRDLHTRRADLLAEADANE